MQSHTHASACGCAQTSTHVHEHTHTQTQTDTYTDAHTHLAQATDFPNTSFDSPLIVGLPFGAHITGQNEGQSRPLEVERGMCFLICFPVLKRHYQGGF